MKVEFLEILNCHVCGHKFKLENQICEHGEIKEGTLECKSCNNKYPIINYIPRLVEKYNYSSSWGLLWKETAHITRDSFTGDTFYKDALHGVYSEDNHANPGSSPFGFNWPTNMEGQKILEVGPGTGCQTEHLVETGAVVVSVDHSDAVDTFPLELLLKKNCHVVQADITKYPVEKSYFDRVWCFQVLQHTPKPPETLQILQKYLVQGGILSVTSYGGKFNPWYYPITRRIPDKMAWKLIQHLFPPVIRLRFFLILITTPMGLARVIRGIFAPFDHRDIYWRVKTGHMNDWIQGKLWNRDKDEKMLMDQVLLNTFDTITPRYTNNCKDHETMQKWLRGAGFSQIHVWGKSGIRATAIK